MIDKNISEKDLKDAERIFILLNELFITNSISPLEASRGCFAYFLSMMEKAKVPLNILKELFAYNLIKYEEILKMERDETNKD